ncbi:glutamate synthase subunit beta, partial [Candidatus Anaplasma sp. TIGMIC]|nr:glutamate synthase subunit beta [Candidatus Anaplasma sp. TIGMIC]
MIALTPADLYSVGGLEKIDALFLENVRQHSPELLAMLVSAREAGYGNTELVEELAHVLETFIARMFCIQPELEKGMSYHEGFLALYKCKRNFVQRYAIKKYATVESIGLDLDEISCKLADVLSARLPIDDNVFARHVNMWMEDTERYNEQLDLAAQYAARSVYDEKESILFQLPKKYDIENLIPVDTITQQDGLCVASACPTILKQRSGFNIAVAPTYE